MAGRITAALVVGALAVAVSGASALAAGNEKEQSKLPSNPETLVASGTPGDKDRTATSATAATVAAPAQKKKTTK